MKSIDHHLYDRNGRFYYRSAIPRNLRPFLPFHEIKLSLGASDLGQARLFVARLDIDASIFNTRTEKNIKFLNKAV